MHLESTNKRVAIVDDDELDRTAIRRALGTLKGLVLEEYSSAETCLAAIADDPPSVVITDIFMPRMDGLELISAIRKMDFEIPIIAISGKSGESIVDYLDVAERFGAVSVVRKDQIADCLTVILMQTLKLHIGSTDRSK